MKVLRKALGNIFKKPITIQYPKKRSPTPKRFRGKHIINFDKCIGCGACARNCPSNAIKLKTKSKKIKVKGIAYQKILHKIDSIDLSRCIFCGLCEEVCPVNAIKLTRNFDMVSYHKTLIRERVER